MPLLGWGGELRELVGVCCFTSMSVSTASSGSRSSEAVKPAGTDRRGRIG